MNNKFYILPIILLIFAGCEKEQPSGYTGVNAVYFADINGKRESNQTFFLIPESQLRDTVFITVNTMGNIAGYDRTVTMQQINGGAADAAKPGTHYLALDDPQMINLLVIPANAASATIPVVLLRHPDMESAEFVLELELMPNEHFQSINAEEYTKFTIHTTAIAAKPDNWDRIFAKTFGNWGSVKMKFIISSTGFTEWDTNVSDSQYLTYLSLKCKAALFIYNQEHDQPLAEADGTPVVFP